MTDPNVPNQAPEDAPVGGDLVPQPPGPGWWQASDGNWYPPQQPAAAPPPPVMQQQPQAFATTIGDIGITQTEIVTPNGTAPLSGSRWICTDQSRVEERMPAYAIVLAIVFFLACLLGLLFLLIKEKKMVGYVEVSVHSGSFYHQTQIPVSSTHQVQQLRQQVGSIQAMAQAA